mgnify:CR=1 FL=1
MPAPADLPFDMDSLPPAVREAFAAMQNALFAGHDAGAENWAVIASLIETCKMNGVDPHGHAHRH